jgi:predicted Zn-dependent peptidase
MRRILLSAVTFLLFFPLACLGYPDGSLEGRVKLQRLGNGLTVLALKRAGAPTVSLQITVVAGGVDEPSGRTGTAHVLEHMLFKGTDELGTRDWKREEPLLRAIEETGVALDEERRKGEAADPAKIEALARRLAELQAQHQPLVVKDEIDAIYSRNGSVGFNAFTTADLTSYIVNLPSNRLEIWAAIESERMRNPVLREYYPEREVVIEERRQRYGRILVGCSTRPCSPRRFLPTRTAIRSSAGPRTLRPSTFGPLGTSTAAITGRTTR